MCGISGYFSPDNFLNQNDLNIMVSAQHHRGPDNKGVFSEKSVGLGHNRLSIIDVSDNGNQPMHSDDQRYVIVYNGEVYNYAEIAAELKFRFLPDLNFKSSSDTEVILEAFACYGESAVNYFNGMFAFAVYDKKEETLFLFRDRVGIKPLYYYWDGKNFAFSSEIKTLKRLDKLNLQVNNTVIPIYFNLGYIPAPHSIYANCYKLEPGHYLKIKKNQLEKVKYWNIADKISENTIDNEKQAIVLISDLLASSVQYQLKSDVPYGIFLSGGIDSSLIAAVAMKLAGTKINSFSIGFENQKFNEADYAKKVAEFLGTNHHEFTVSVNDAINTLEDYINAYGEPFADSSGIPTLMVSKLAKQYVTVALSGEGGDELFHGYGSYKWASRLNNPLLFANRGLISKILKQSSSARYKRIGDMFNAQNKNTLRSHIFSQEQYFFPSKEIHDLLKQPYLYKNELLHYTDTFFAEIQTQIEKKRNLKAQEKQALYDMCFYLPDNLLVKVDRASMWHSLETRVPYLDHRLIEKAININTALKDKPEPKYLLKEILYQYVPQYFFDRPKQGFSIPLKIWLKSEMRFLINDFLNETVITRVNIVNYNIVKNLVERFDRGEEHLFQRLWLLINFHKWYLKNGGD